MRLSASFIVLTLCVSLLSACGKVVTPPTDTGASVTETGTNSLLSEADKEKLRTPSSSESINIVEDSLMDVSTHLFSDAGRSNIQQYIRTLSGSSGATIVKRSYLQSYVGDYAPALAERAELCKQNPKECPGKYLDLEIQSINDQSGNTLEGSRVYLNTQLISSGTKEPPVYRDFFHRVRVEKEGYMDAYDKLNGITAEGASTRLVVRPVLAKADAMVDLPALQGGSAKAGIMSYSIPPNAFRKTNGDLVSGVVKVYTFSFDRDDKDLSVFQLQSYSADGSKAGDSFVTYGMPYVTAYQNGEALEITTPIEGTGTILYTDGMDLVNVPKNTWLGGVELAKYNIPPFWNLDRKAGVWNESKIRILDEKGTYNFKLSEK